MWTQIWPRCGNSGWPEVVHPGKDCRISPTGHGLYGQDDYGYRERDRGCTEYPRYGY